VCPEGAAESSAPYRIEIMPERNPKSEGGIGLTQYVTFHLRDVARRIVSPKAFPEKKADIKQQNVRLASRLRALLPLWEFNHVWPTLPIARMIDKVVLSFVRLFFAVPLLCGLDRAIKASSKVEFLFNQMENVRVRRRPAIDFVWTLCRGLFASVVEQKRNHCDR
jgi:hypothetical protein